MPKDYVVTLFCIVQHHLLEHQNFLECKNIKRWPARSLDFGGEENGNFTIFGRQKTGTAALSRSLGTLQRGLQKFHQNKNKSMGQGPFRECLGNSAFF